MCVTCSFDVKTRFLFLIGRQRKSSRLRADHAAHELRPKLVLAVRAWSARHFLYHTGDDEGTFVSVIVYDVQDDLDAGSMQRGDQLLELQSGCKGTASARSKARHRRKEVDVRVTPHVHHVVPGIFRPLQSRPH